MKRKLTILLLCLLTLLTCSCSKNTAKTETTEETESSTSESEVPTPTPASTYTPGDDLYGMLSVTGDVVIEPQYNYLGLFTQENLARFQDYETGLWGYINESGKEVIPAQYEDAQDFSEGLAAVETDGLYGFIDVSGEMVIAPQFEGVASEFTYDRCVFTKDNLMGLIDLSGNEILKPTYSTILISSSKYFVVSNGSDEYGIINSNGEAFVDCQYPEITTVTEAGCFFVKRSDADTSMIQFDMYDVNGNSYVGFSNYFELLGEGNALVEYLEVSSDGENWGLFDLKQGIYAIDPIYSQVVYYQGTRYAQVYTKNDIGVYDLTTGLITWDVIQDGTYGVQYDQIIFTEDGKEGVKNPDGTIVLNATYDSVSCSPYGVYAVSKDDKYYMVDSSGDILREFDDRIVYGYIESIDCWQFIYKENLGEYSIDGFISRNGDEVLDVNCLPYDINGMSLYISKYPDLMDLSQSPAIFTDLPSLGTENNDCSDGYGFIHPFIQTEYVLYNAYSWFPSQGVLVVEDSDGNYGLVSYDGTVLFEPAKCHIFINSNTGTIEYQDEKYQYDTYNDSEYLIYTVDR